MEEINKLGVGSSSGSTCVDVGCDIVDLFVALLDHDSTSCGSGVGCQHYTVLELDTHDRGACLFMRDGLDVFAFEKGIAA